MNQKLIFILACCLSFLSFGQGVRWSKPNAGVQAGLVLEAGTHELAIGFHLKSFIGFDYAQLNVGNTFMWKFYSLGKREMFYENRFYAGGALMVGKNQSVVDFELDGLNHQTKKNFAVAYNFLIYSDNAGTSQLSGAFGMHIKNVSIKFENDVFSGQAKDRFRTGILDISYRTPTFKINTGFYIWTGETAGSFWDKSVKTKKMPSGYRSLEDLPYGKTTHGIVYGGIKYLMHFGNVVHARIGVDSEQFRHALQNRLIHDMAFLPQTFPRNTPHYPRLDENGCPVFEKELVRKPKFYLQFGINE